MGSANPTDTGRCPQEVPCSALYSASSSSYVSSMAFLLAGRGAGEKPGEGASHLTSAACALAALLCRKRA